MVGESWASIDALNKDGSGRCWLWPWDVHFHNFLIGEYIIFLIANIPFWLGEGCRPMQRGPATWSPFCEVTRGGLTQLARCPQVYNGLETCEAM